MGLSASTLGTVYYVARLCFVGCTADMEALSTIFGNEQGVIPAPAGVTA
jgi:hypothetical protein